MISTVASTATLGVERVAGLVDQDFDDAALNARDQGLPIFWCGNADLEAFLFTSSALDDLLEELSSEQKLRAYGGIAAIRRRAIAVALEVAALRVVNAVNGWGLPFDDVDMSKKLHRDNLTLKRASYCQALTAKEYVEVVPKILHEAIELCAGNNENEECKPPFFSGKDALVGRSRA